MHLFLNSLLENLEDNKKKLSLQHERKRFPPAEMKE